MGCASSSETAAVAAPSRIVPAEAVGVPPSVTLIEFDAIAAIPATDADAELTDRNAAAATSAVSAFTLATSSGSQGSENSDPNSATREGDAPAAALPDVIPAAVAAERSMLASTSIAQAAISRLAMSATAVPRGGGDVDAVSPEHLVCRDIAEATPRPPPPSSREGAMLRQRSASGTRAATAPSGGSARLEQTTAHNPLARPRRLPPVPALPTSTFRAPQGNDATTPPMMQHALETIARRCGRKSSPAPRLP